MKAWGKIRCKHLFSSESASEAVTPVVGSILMLLILVVLAGAVANSIFNSVGEDANFQPLIAKITIKSCDGGLRYAPKSENATFENNSIVLAHEGGSPLPLDATCIKILGDGNTYQGDVGGGGITIKGKTEVFYQNLSPTGKNPTYYVVNNKATLEDGSWDVGEKLVLCGQDSAEGIVKSSVKVSVDGDSDTSDNYGFKAGSEITLKVIDIKNSNVIAEQRAIIKHAE
ncbi:type IV pilin [Methanosarcina sp.]|uniref:type IV pilin n=1 Tax=Methanosarcina sp. TaxID=2213 RepID=UPI003C70F8CB